MPLASPPLPGEKNTDIGAWGPQLWHTLHMVALNYPDAPSPDDKRNYKAFFESLQFVIPCASCADNYALHLRQLPVDRFLDNADALFAWSVHVHNMVNKSYGKRSWSVADAKRYYVDYRATTGAPATERQFVYLRELLINLLILLACLIVAATIIYASARGIIALRTVRWAR